MKSPAGEVKLRDERELGECRRRLTMRLVNFNRRRLTSERKAIATALAYFSLAFNKKEKRTCCWERVLFSVSGIRYLREFTPLSVGFSSGCLHQSHAERAEES